jgi:hypothetical protein
MLNIKKYCKNLILKTLTYILPLLMTFQFKIKQFEEVEYFAILQNF